MKLLITFKNQVNPNLQVRQDQEEAANLDAKDTQTILPKVLSQVSDNNSTLDIGV